MRPFLQIDWEKESFAFSAADPLLALAAGEPEQIGLLGGFRTLFSNLQRFRVSATTFSPMMLYGLFALGCLRAPGSIFVAGIDAGLSAAALAAGGNHGLCDVGATRVEGSARSVEQAELAVENLAFLNFRYPVSIRLESASAGLRGLRDGSVDMIFLDSWPEDHPGMMPDVLRALSPDRGILAVHDALLPRCIEDMDKVRAAVESTGKFATFLLPLDEMGLWVARRKGEPLCV